MPGPLPLHDTATSAVPDPPLRRAARRILSTWLYRLAMDRWRLGEGLAQGEGADAAPLTLVA